MTHTVRINPTFSHASPDLIQSTESAFPLTKSQYQLLHMIGRGEQNMSEVYAARCLVNDRQVAAKLINLDLCDLDLDQFRRDTVVWQTSSHPNLITYYGSFVSDSILWCLAEYMDGGSIADIMAFGYPRGFTDEIVIASILHPLLQFLAYFHERRQLHRGIRPSNILLTMDGEVKIGDMESAATLILDGQRRRARFTVIESPYTAPETMMEGTGYTEKSDIWSVGITAIALATGSTPFDKYQALALVQAIVTGPTPSLPSQGGYSSQLRDFVKQCLHRDPGQRPTAEQLLKHSFIKKEKGRDYLRTITGNLPPLYKRFEALNEKATGNITKQVSQAGPKTEFTFDLGEIAESKPSPAETPVDPEAVPTTIGRFKVTVRPPKEKEVVPEDPGLITLNPEIDPGAEAKQMSSELEAIRESNRELQELVAEALESVKEIKAQKGIPVGDV
jgi:serine/threonine-protein kinase OSR1/STK39